MRLVHGRRKALVKGVALLLAAVGLFLFFKIKKEALKTQAYRWFEKTLSRQSDLEIKVGKVRGNLMGLLAFDDVSARAPWLPDEQAIVFRAKTVEFHYRLLDFFSKTFETAHVDVVLKDPEIVWHPQFRMKKPSFPFFDWLRDWTVSQGRLWRLRAKNLTLTMGYEKRKLSGIDLFLEKGAFEADIPIAHLALGAMDLSSLVHVQAHFDKGVGAVGDVLTGQISTSGSVVNWKPLPKESKFDFVLSSESFKISSADALGGLEVVAFMDFTKNFDIDVALQARQYPLSNLGLFLGWNDQSLVPTHMDLELRLWGRITAPEVELRSRLYKGWVGRRVYKAMDVNATGVYPTLRLEDSRILMEEGTVMRFAERTLEVNDLFKEKTYQKLVAEAEQDTVVWGDWEFSRTRNLRDEPGFLMQRALGDNAKLHFRRYSVDADNPATTDTHDMEVGFEYRLKSKDTVKVEFRDDEEFVGVERKMTF